MKDWSSGVEMGAVRGLCRDPARGRARARQEKGWGSLRADRLDSLDKEATTAPHLHYSRSWGTDLGVPRVPKARQAKGLGEPEFQGGGRNCRRNEGQGRRGDLCGAGCRVFGKRWCSSGQRRCMARFQEEEAAETEAEGGSQAFWELRRIRCGGSVQCGKEL